MDELNLKRNIAKNITYYRKLNNWTQLELAEKINYSDKSVSKWERAEGLPDIVVLTLLSELFGVSVNDLLCDDIPKTPVVQKSQLSLRTKITVLLLSVGLVWLVASLVFFFLEIAAPELRHSGYAFLVAVPVSLIVALVFCCLWWGWLLRCICASALVWSLAAMIQIFLPFDNAVMIYVVAAVFQVLIILWYMLKTKIFDREASDGDSVKKSDDR